MIRYLKQSLQPFLLPTLSLAFAACAPVPGFYEAQNLSAKPFNQLDLAGNACGPASLLNSYRFGDPNWRKLSEEPAGLSDRERIRAIARGPAMRESSSLPGRARWSRRGINLSDLREVANEMASPAYLPSLAQQTLFLKPTESQQSHIQRVHSLLASSLKAEIPPILSIRRFAKRGGKWTSIQAHFVTVISVPGNIPTGETSFPVKYIDPLGGNFREGRIAISRTAFLQTDPAANPNLEAIFPDVTIGKNSLRSGETSYLAVSAVLGKF